MLVVVFCTAFHNRWNATVGVRHPNLWTFVRRLKDEERNCQRTIRAAARGDTPPPGKRRFRQLQQRITRLQQEYRSGNRSLTGYWEAVAHAVPEFD